MAFKALHGATAVDSRSIDIELSGAPTRIFETNLFVHRAINNSVKSSFKYRFGKSWSCLSAAAKTADNLRFFKRLI